MKIRDAIGQYIAWRQAHGTQFKLGGGAAGSRHERARDRRGDGPRGKYDPLACEAHVRQAPPVAASRLGAAGAVAGRRSGATALEVEAAAGRR